MTGWGGVALAAFHCNARPGDREANSAQQEPAGFQIGPIGQDSKIPPARQAVNAQIVLDLAFTIRILCGAERIDEGGLQAGEIFKIEGDIVGEPHRDELRYPLSGTTVDEIGA